MILLVEGFNRVGKSSVCEALQKDLPEYEYVHFGVPDRHDAYDYFVEKLPKDAASANLIIDRLHWSNAAFNGVLGGPVLTPFDWWRIDHWLAEGRAAALLLVDNPHAIYQRLEAERYVRPTHYQLFPPSIIGEVQNTFLKCFARSEIGLRWSFGLDQLLNVGASPPTTTETYARLLKLLRGEDPE